MRPLAWIAALACVSACARRSHGPSPAADASQLHVDETVQSVWLVEVSPNNPEAERDVGQFGRNRLIAQFESLYRLACGRGTRLVIVADPAIAEHITFRGERLRTVGFQVGWRGYYGLEIPC